MKKIIVLLSFLSACCSACGQGTVNFANAGVGVNAPVYFIYVGSGVKLSGPGWVADLWSGQAGSTESMLKPLRQPAPFRTGAQTGYFTGGARTIPGVHGGSVATLQVRVWNLQDGATWEEALARPSCWGYGKSGMFNVTLTEPPYTPANFTGLTSFSAGCLSPFLRISSQPESKTVPWGGTVSFTVGSSACPCPQYQWVFNGTPIPGATNNLYTIDNVQLQHAGVYAVLVNNFLWSESSSNATLTVLGEPIITVAPQSQTAEAGSSLQLHGAAAGPPPLGYQWYFQGDAIPGGTSTHLTLLSIQPVQAGAYSFTATNQYGSASASPAVLSVIGPVPRRLAPALLLQGQPGTVLNLDIATNLNLPPDWAFLDSVLLATPAQWFFDLHAVPQGFYRAWQTNQTGPIPGLQMHLVPELALTGPVGSRVRLEAINRLGPTDAWFWLAEVVLTNTTHPFYDTSAIGQPPRLRRFTPQ